MAKPPNAVCLACGGAYRAKPNEIRRQRTKYCSRQCKDSQSVPPTWRATDVERAKQIRAQGLINHRLKRGKIKRPGACESCGAEKRLDAHHPDYDKPDEVVWLCRSCHAKEHQ